MQKLFFRQNLIYTFLLLSLVLQNISFAQEEPAPLPLPEPMPRQEETTSASTPQPPPQNTTQNEQNQPASPPLPPPTVQEPTIPEIRNTQVLVNLNETCNKGNCTGCSDAKFNSRGHTSRSLCCLSNKNSQGCQ